MFRKPKISYETVKRNKTLSGFMKPKGKPLEEEEEISN